MTYKALRHEVLDIGSTIKSSKQRYIWEFRDDSKEDADTHLVILDDSVLSGGKKLTYNDKEVCTEYGVYNRFNFKFIVAKEQMEVTVEPYFQGYTIIVNGVYFNDLNYKEGQGSKKGHKKQTTHNFHHSSSCLEDEDNTEWQDVKDQFKSYSQKEQAEKEKKQAPQALHLNRIQSDITSNKENLDTKKTTVDWDKEFEMFNQKNQQLITKFKSTQQQQSPQSSDQVTKSTQNTSTNNWGDFDFNFNSAKPNSNNQGQQQNNGQQYAQQPQFHSSNLWNNNNNGQQQNQQQQQQITHNNFNNHFAHQNQNSHQNTTNNNNNYANSQQFYSQPQLGQKQQQISVNLLDMDDLFSPPPQNNNHNNFNTNNNNSIYQTQQQAVAALF